MAIKGSDNVFVQEYLYIEEYPIDAMQLQYIVSTKKKSDEPKRGVVVIDLLGNEENTEET